MSHKNETDENLNDADLANLFAANEKEPTAEIDQLILAKARSVSPPTASIVHRETFLQKYTPLFGSAAVLVIGIALAPRLMEAPEYELDAAKLNQTQNQSVDTTLGQVQTNPLADTTRAESEIAAMPDNNPSPLQNTETAAQRKDPSLIQEESDDNAGSVSDTIATEDRELVTQKIQAKTSRLPLESANSTTPSATVAPEPAQPSQTQQMSPSLAESNLPEVTPLPLAEPKAAITSAADSATGSVRQRTGTLNSAKDDKKPRVFSRSTSQQAQALTQTTEDVKKPTVTEPLQQFALSSKQNSAAETSITPSTAAGAVQQSAKPRPTNFRNSELLWVLEIKFLHNDEQRSSANRELSMFRENYPNSHFEILLPDDLRKTQ